MGHAAGLLDALPRGPLPGRDPRRRLAGRAERVDLVRGARAVGARRRARDPGRERPRRVARPRGRVGERRDRVALGDPQDGEADGPVPAGHRLRHLGLLGDAARGQHLRRRQLRRRRPRRVDDRPARLAGRRAGSSRSPRTTCSRVRAKAARAVQAVFAGLGFPPVTDDGGRGGHLRLRQPRPARPRPRRRRRGRRPRARWTGRSRRSTSSASSTRPASPTSPRRCSGCSGSASPPTISRPRPSSSPTAPCARRSATRTAIEGPGTGYRLEGERWELLQQLPYVLDPREETSSNGVAVACVVETHVATVGDRAGRRRRRGRAGVRRRRCGTTINGLSARGRPARRSPRASARRAAEPRLVRVRAQLRRRLHRPRRREAGRLGDRASGSSRRARR